MQMHLWAALKGQSAGTCIICCSSLSWQIGVSVQSGSKGWRSCSPLFCLRVYFALLLKVQAVLTAAVGSSMIWRWVNSVVIMDAMVGWRNVQV